MRHDPLGTLASASDRRTFQRDTKTIDDGNYGGSDSWQLANTRTTVRLLPGQRIVAEKVNEVVINESPRQRGTMGNMRILGEITCQLSDNGVKSGILYCNEPEAYRLAEWTAAGSTLTAIATIALVVAAIWAGRTALNTLKQQQKDSYAAWRPYLTVQVLPSLAGAPNFDLVIENVGGSPALGIEISSTDFPNKMDKVSESIRDLFKVVTFLGRGARTRNYWRLEVAKGSTWSDNTTDPVGMPQSASLTVRYHDLEGKKFEDEFVVDTNIYKLAPLPADGPNPIDSLSDAEKDLHQMLAVIAVAIGEHRR
ncbi:hypothetical protein [Arthrobacter sp. A5]|uniref:hypothetical protein n=1 Tax=Arthrobacter sp. A5 TaxID=576926 RepID=UPI003DA93285